MSRKDIENYIENFKNISSWHEKDFSDENTIKKAVEKAYSDAKRTMTGIKETERDNAKKELAEAIKKYFEADPPSNEEDFDKQHGKLCETWQSLFTPDNLKTYGKAQKIVNMSFKYLYCCDISSKQEAYFEYCHMPLDSFILEWFKRNIKTSSKDTPIRSTWIESWSSLQNSTEDSYKNSKGEKRYSYNFLVNEIRNYCKNDLTPLQLEFIVWPEIQIKLAAEAFLFALLDDDLDNNEKKAKNKEIREKSLDNNLKEIRDRLNLKINNS